MNMLSGTMNKWLKSFLNTPPTPIAAIRVVRGELASTFLVSSTDQLLLLANGWRNVSFTRILLSVSLSALIIIHALFFMVAPAAFEGSWLALAVHVICIVSYATLLPLGIHLVERQVTRSIANSLEVSAAMQDGMVCVVTGDVAKMVTESMDQTRATVKTPSMEC